jgi:hypothetical protein
MHVKREAADILDRMDPNVEHTRGPSEAHPTEDLTTHHRRSNEVATVSHPKAIITAAVQAPMSHPKVISSAQQSYSTMKFTFAFFFGASSACEQANSLAIRILT